MREKRQLTKAKSETDSPDYTDRVFDGWNPVYERTFDASSELPLSDTVYVWGTDLFGSLQSAGGVGGLLGVKRDGAWYAPLYDANGHQKSAKPKAMPPGDRDFIAVPRGRSEERYPATQRQLYVTAYISETGAVVAEYEYDAFGNTISQSGSFSDTFRHRFSTKPWIAALGAYDYGERVYSPELRRWLSRDPIEEEGGVNLYAMCGNGCLYRYDCLGLSFGTIGPNTGSVVEHFGGESVRYESDLWLAVYGESRFKFRRRIKIKACECLTGENADDIIDYFSIPSGEMYFGKGNVDGGNWASNNIRFKQMYYAEVFAMMHGQLSGLKGSAEVIVQLTKYGTRPRTDVRPKPLPGDGFGTENNGAYGDNSTTHPVENFLLPRDEDDTKWQHEGIIAEIRFTLALDCDNGITLKSPPTKTGDWKLDGQNWHRALGNGLPPRARGMPIQ